jgi:hypothetical protein
MSVITVPFDFDEKEHSGIVPIGISTVDANGNEIPKEWIELGVVPVADPLRKVAARVLNDVWRVSEITDHAVHSLARRNGANVGDAPELRVLKCAHWYAEDLRVGGRRYRRSMDVELFDSTLDALQDQADIVRDLEHRDTVDRLMQQLERMGLDEVREMVPMMLRDCDADEFCAKFGKSRNTISQQFYRGIRKAATLAGIPLRPSHGKGL